MFWIDGAGYGVAECHATYVGKSKGKALYEEAKFRLAASRSENWTGIFDVHFKTAGGECWSTPQRNGFTGFLARCRDSGFAGSGAVQVQVSVADPDFERPLQWQAQIANSGAIRCVALGTSPVQIPLTLRIDRNNGVFSGAYLNPVSKKHRYLSGCVAGGGSAPQRVIEGWIDTRAAAAPLARSGVWEASVIPEFQSK
jgi:hypothetical protein